MTEETGGEGVDPHLLCPGVEKVVLLPMSHFSVRSTFLQSPLADYTLVAHWPEP